MIHASLFSGIGGPEVAAAMMGWTNAFHCEINPFGRKVLEYWFPESKSYEDITKTDFSEWRGKIDIITGGFPCQPFSYAGKRGGAEDDRYLWPQMLRVIEEVRPTWVIGENVNGITTMVEGGVLAEVGSEATLFGEGDTVHRYELRESFTIERICRDLEGIGYSVQPIVVPAASVGAPHRRDRVFILAYASNPLHDNTVRTAGGDEGQGGEERLRERDKVERFAESNYVRSEMRCDAPDSDGGGCETPKAGGGVERGGSHGDVFQGKRERKAQRPNGCPSVPRDTPYTHGRGSGEVPAPIHAGESNGDKPLSDGEKRDVTHSHRKGQQEPIRPAGAEDSEEARGRLHDRVERSGRNGRIANALCERLEGRDQPRSGEGEERLQVRGDLTRHDCEDLLPERRWAEFPTVSPVHRGNDGLPFPLDNLTISPNQWRTESLKAYGNAIVVQVMYRIFQAIEQVGL